MHRACVQNSIVCTIPLVNPLRRVRTVIYDCRFRTARVRENRQLSNERARTPKLARIGALLLAGSTLPLSNANAFISRRNSVASASAQNLSSLRESRWAQITRPNHIPADCGVTHRGNNHRPGYPAVSVPLACEILFTT